jgi:hypothetical protein
VLHRELCCRNASPLCSGQCIGRIQSCRAPLAPAVTEDRMHKHYCTYLHLLDLLTPRCCLQRLLLDFTLKSLLFLPRSPTHLQLLHISTIPCLEASAAHWPCCCTGCPTYYTAVTTIALSAVVWQCQTTRYYCCTTSIPALRHHVVSSYCSDLSQHKASTVAMCYHSPLHPRGKLEQDIPQNHWQAYKRNQQPKADARTGHTTAPLASVQA